MPDWQPTPQSSNIDAAARDGPDLLVRFKSGEEYRYAGAGGQLDALVNSPSPGSHFYRHVKSRYPAEQA